MWRALTSKLLLRMSSLPRAISRIVLPGRCCLGYALLVAIYLQCCLSYNTTPNTHRTAYLSLLRVYAMYRACSVDDYMLMGYNTNVHTHMRKGVVSLAFGQNCLGLRASSSYISLRIPTRIFTRARGCTSCRVGLNADGISFTAACLC